MNKNLMILLALIAGPVLDSLIVWGMLILLLIGGEKEGWDL